MNNKYCDYGCGQESNYQFKNGKWCCSNHWLQCPNQRNKQKGSSNPFYKKEHTSEVKLKISEKNKGKIPWNLGIKRTEEEKLKISEKTILAMKDEDVRKRMSKKVIRKGENHPSWKGGYSKKGIPLFVDYEVKLGFFEEIRRNTIDKNILEVRCTYCGNWFIPTYIQVYERIRSFNGTNYGEQRFYCSDLCKNSCSIFHQIKYPKDHKPSTSREVQPELRKLRFKIDNYTCQKCKKHQTELDVPLHCHHIEGIRWEPLESADIDKVITYCETCHLKSHTQPDCSYFDMQCNNLAL